MNTKRTSLELIAPSVEEAVQNGLDELRLRREEVDVEILDEGNRGLFGLGSRQARVRLTVRGMTDLDEVKFPDAVPENEVDQDLEPSVFDDETEYPADLSAAESIFSAEELMEDLSFQVVRETILELLSLMNIQAEVSLRYGETDEMRSRAPIMADIHGEDLSILIGKRAETLNALQYIANLIISKELGRYVTLIIDVEGYRERRNNQLRQIAKRMAEQAIKTGRRQILEPMPANERRIIHMELRNYPALKTESIGEDPYRKVTIIPN
jgi:spoIIIJ-associated protein